MYQLKKSTENELSKVQSAIKNELATEKIIKEIYEYIFNKEGKEFSRIIGSIDFDNLEFIEWLKNYN